MNYSNKTLIFHHYFVLSFLVAHKRTIRSPSIPMTWHLFEPLSQARDGTLYDAKRSVYDNGWLQGINIIYSFDHSL